MHRSQIYMDLNYIDPQSRVLNYCFTQQQQQSINPGATHTGPALTQTPGRAGSLRRAGSFGKCTVPCDVMAHMRVTDSEGAQRCDVTQRIARIGAEKRAGELTTGSAGVASTRMAAVLIYSGQKQTAMARISSSSRRNYRLSSVTLA